MPESVDLVSVGTDETKQEMLVQHGQHRAGPVADGVAVAAALQPVAGADVDEDGFLLDETLHRVLARGFDRKIDLKRASRSDDAHEER